MHISKLEICFICTRLQETVMKNTEKNVKTSLFSKVLPCLAHDISMDTKPIYISHIRQDSTGSYLSDGVWHVYIGQS